MVVTGAGGQIGYELTSMLSDKTKVVAIYRSWKNILKPLLSAKVKLLQTDPMNMSKQLGKVEFVYHMAGSTKESIMDRSNLIKENIQSTCDVLEFMRKTDSVKMVFASTSAVYGPGRGKRVAEEASLCPEWSSYAMSKYLCEKICFHYCKLYGLKVIVARIFPVYGGNAESSRRLVPTIFHKVLAGQEITIAGEGNQMRDFMHVSDTSNALIQIQKNFEKLHHEHYNIGTGKGITIRDLVALIGRITGAKPKVVYDHKDVYDLGNIAISRRIQDDTGFKPVVYLEEGLSHYRRLTSAITDNNLGLNDEGVMRS